MGANCNVEWKFYCFSDYQKWQSYSCATVNHWGLEGIRHIEWKDGYYYWNVGWNVTGIIAETNDSISWSAENMIWKRKESGQGNVCLIIKVAKYLKYQIQEWSFEFGNIHSVKLLRIFIDWDPLNVSQESCGHGNDFNVIYVSSLKECKKKSEAYKALWFPEKREESGDFKCKRYMECLNYGFMESVPGSTYGKSGGYCLDFYPK